MNNFKLKKGLGRGLSSLIGDSGSKSKQSNLKIDDIMSNPYQPRKTFDDEQLNDLTNSIEDFKCKKLNIPKSGALKSN